MKCQASIKNMGQVSIAENKRVRPRRGLNRIQKYSIYKKTNDLTTVQKHSTLIDRHRST